MAEISQNVNIEMLEKLPDGTYKRKYPATKAEVVKLVDAQNKFTNKNVEGAMNELFTNVSNGKDLVGGAITDVDDSIVIPTDPTFQDLADAIGQISTGISISEPLTAGDCFLYVDPEMKTIPSSSYTKLFEAQIQAGGGVRVAFDLRKPGTSGNFSGRVYINGVARGSERTTPSNYSTVTYTQDFEVNKYDLIQIYALDYYPQYNCLVGNFKVGVDLGEPESLAIKKM